jgi:hypothetical protein
MGLWPLPSCYAGVTPREGPGRHQPPVRYPRQASPQDDSQNPSDSRCPRSRTSLPVRGRLPARWTSRWGSCRSRSPRRLTTSNASAAKLMRRSKPCARPSDTCSNCPLESRARIDPAGSQTAFQNRRDHEGFDWERSWPNLRNVLGPSAVCISSCQRERQAVLAPEASPNQCRATPPSHLGILPAKTGGRRRRQVHSVSRLR